MTDVSPLIDAMGLAPHPEGGHYRRTWTAPTRVDTPRGSRHSASAIIFLLDHDEEARWHLVHSDELWIWSGPGALEVHLGGSGDAPSADPTIVTLGSPASGQASTRPTRADPRARRHLAAHLRPRDYALATCVVSPEFTFDDWMLAEAN